jgi:hypothetical protein
MINPYWRLHDSRKMLSTMIIYLFYFVFFLGDRYQLELIVFIKLCYHLSLACDFYQQDAV